jgi:TonB-dependent receptor-like protein/carboxypeptidase family protein
MRSASSSARIWRTVLVFLAIPVLGAQASPAADSTSVLRGVVRMPTGEPIAEANVFLIETLEGVLTRADGRFAISTAATGPATLVIRRLGFTEIRRTVELPTRDTLVIAMTPAPIALSAITVQAGQYTASAERGATLTPLEVVTTPGTAADVNRAIQALPGVQAVDEGTGLFVRGGDFTETKVFLDEAGLHTGPQFQQPSGTFTGTVDPFLLDGIFFSSGGFGARYGDALSGVAGLTTQRRPARTSGTATAGLAAFSAALAVALPGEVGVRGAANRTDLDPMLAVNGNPRGYDPAPHGYDVSGSLIWQPRPTAEVKAFALDQTTSLGMGLDEASFSGAYGMAIRSRVGVLSWHDVFGAVTPSLAIATTRATHDESYGAFQLARRFDDRQLFAQMAWGATDRLTLRAGGEVDRASSAIEGTVPRQRDDVGPGARLRVLGGTETGTRIGAFVESDWRVSESTRLVTGVRSDRSTLTGERTIDPRASLAVKPFHGIMRTGVTFTAAWGIYHQVPDPLLFDDTLGVGALAPMRAEQRVAGLQVGEERTMARVELYEKRYRDLAQQTRDFTVVPDGVGAARGMDVLLKGSGPFRTTGRVIYSYLSSRRTDASSGVVARAPFDITHNVTAVVERVWGMHWRSAIAYRSATGKPYTPITGATRDPVRGVYTPVYGRPMSERLPAFRRVDLSASYFSQFSPNLQGVFFVALNNALDRENVYAYRYTADYRRRFPVRSVFNRSVYFGMTFTRM